MDCEHRSLLALSLVPGLGAVRVARLIEYFGSAEAAWAAPKDALDRVPGIGRAISAAIIRARGEGAVDRQLRLAAGCGARIATWLDAEYPARLRGIPASPPVLYARGLWDQGKPAVAIVGTRRATPYGLGVAERLAAALAGRGIVIVSGLARGIDGAAHRAAVRAGGSTVGVLGCGVDVAYPPEHASLMEAMIAAGAVIAEAPMGAAPSPGLFPARNRLISGLGDAVVVVEGDADGGAMITARHAKAQGRPVFAVPGNVHARGSRGPHHLLAAGARILADPDDVLAVLGHPVAGETPGRRCDPGPARRRGTSFEMGSCEGRVIAVLDEGEARSIDDLAEATGMAVAEVAAALVALELGGAISRTAGGLYWKTAAAGAGRRW